MTRSNACAIRRSPADSIAVCPSAVLRTAVAYTAADLQMIDDHIAQGERHVIHQEELITRLRSHGLPTAAAEDLLADFRSLLQQHWAHRALVLKDLSPD